MWSPCDGKCELHKGPTREVKVCKSCGRTQNEIATWKYLTTENKEEIKERVSKWQVKNKN